MKKLIVAVVMLSATFTFAAAQQGGGQRLSAEERAKLQTDRLANLISLSAEQKTKIEAIEVELSKKIEAARQNAQGNREAMQAEFQKIDKTRDEKYKDVLTADQFKTYLDKKEELRQRRPGQGDGQRRPGQGDGQRQGNGTGQGRRSN